MAVQESNTTHVFVGCDSLFSESLSWKKLGCQDPGAPGVTSATGTRSLCSTDGAIAALLLDGRVQVWGDAMKGGNLEEVPHCGGRGSSFGGLFRWKCCEDVIDLVQILTVTNDLLYIEVEVYIYILLCLGGLESRKKQACQRHEVEIL